MAEIHTSQKYVVGFGMLADNIMMLLPIFGTFTLLLLLVCCMLRRLAVGSGGEDPVH